MRIRYVTDDDTGFGSFVCMLNQPVLDWCAENLEGAVEVSLDPHFEEYVGRFSCVSDAVHFKLRWA